MDSAKAIQAEDISPLPSDGEQHLEDKARVVESKDEGALSDLSKELLKLHVAEYQMLCGRATSLMVSEVQAASIFLVSVALLANAQVLSHAPKGYLIWGGFIFLQIIGLFQSNCQINVYESIFYIETKIRPAVQKLTQQKGTFWEYEQHLSVQRRKRPLFVEWAIPLFDVALFLLACILRFKICAKEPVTSFDGIGAGVNAFAVVSIVVLNLKSTSIRKQWSEKAKLPKGIKV